MHRPRKSKSDKKPLGLFHQFDVELREALVLVAMEDAPTTRQQNNDDLNRQAKARRRKEELAKEQNMQKATDEYIEACYYHMMYNSDACWKGDQRVVACELKKLTSTTAKLDALKENIKIRWKGFNWDWCQHAWSKDGRKYTVKELANHLRWIIKEEKRRKLTRPGEPEPDVPKRKKNSSLGTITSFAASLDKKYLADEDEFKKNATHIRRAREARGEGSMYSILQPFSRPDVSELINRRIDVLVSFDVKGHDIPQLRWCQGEVVDVYENKRQPTVRVLWDPMPDVDGGDETTESDQILLPSKWKKDKVGAWRMDVSIAVLDENDSEFIAEMEMSDDEMDIDESDGDGSIGSESD